MICGGRLGMTRNDHRMGFGAFVKSRFVRNRAFFWSAQAPRDGTRMTRMRRSTTDKSDNRLAHRHIGQCCRPVHKPAINKWSSRTNVRDLCQRRRMWGGRAEKRRARHAPRRPAANMVCVSNAFHGHKKHRKHIRHARRHRLPARGPAVVCPAPRLWQRFLACARNDR